MKNTKVIIGVLVVVVVIAAVVFTGKDTLFKGSLTSAPTSVAKPAITVNSQYNFQSQFPASGGIVLLDFTATAPKNSDILYDKFFVKYNFESGSRMVKNINLEADNVVYWHTNHVVITDNQSGKYVGNGGAGVKAGNNQLAVSIKNPTLSFIKAGTSKRFRLLGEVASVDRIKVDLLQ